MFLKINRIQQFEDLLLESDIIKIGDALAKVGDKKETGGEASDNWNEVDYLIDQLLERGIVDIAQDLKRPIFEKELGTEFSKEKIKRYIAYCKSRAADVDSEIQSIMSDDPINTARLEELMLVKIRIAARIQVLEKVYSAFKLINSEEIKRIADEVLQAITALKMEFAGQYMDFLTTLGDKVKPEISIVESPDSDQEEKFDSARKIIDAFDSADQVIEMYPPEVQTGEKQAKAKAEQTIKTEIGEENFNRVKEEALRNKQEAVILRRILDMRYKLFTTKEEIYSEADQIKKQINGLRGTNNKFHTQSISEIIQYLTDELAKMVDELLNRVRDKSMDLGKAKGIHYKFNTKLKLHELTTLPVTGQQIADSSALMKFRKWLTSVLGAFPAAQPEMTSAGRAWADFGEKTHGAYAKTLNTAAKFIGRLFGGREGEMKADAISRMFIPGPNVLDKKPAIAPITEDGDSGVAPGVSMQVPGSISRAGAIRVPTENSLGSGDFNMGKKKKKKKHRSVYEDNMTIMNFSQFLNENKTPKNGI
jgi:hypothetical protein